jgi:hypothetical protein
LQFAIFSGVAFAQTPDHLGFQALPRTISYATPLTPAQGAQAVIVYGKKADWTQAAALRVQKAVQDWSGKKLDVIDDLTATSEDTWLIADAYRHTPMIVIGNTQDNRLIQALGTRYLDSSNHSWPGGDRYLVRTVFEPFAADTNHIVLSASNETGATGATAALEAAIKKLPKDDASTIPFTRIIAGTNDKWLPVNDVPVIPKEFATPSKSVTEVAAKAAVAPYTAGEPLGYSPFSSEPYLYALGGTFDEHYTAMLTDESNMIPVAAIFLNGVRAAGGRTHIPFHHYGGMGVLMGIRGIFQSGILNEKEFNEFESAMVYSGAYPAEYWYDRIDSEVNPIHVEGGRHGMACLLITINTLDYVMNHCKMDDRTRQEIQRRYNGCRKTCASYVRSFRDKYDTWELGETTMMQFYATLYAGFPEVVKNGTLKHMADMYILTSDNLKQIDYWQIPGLYAGLDSYIGAGPGMAMASWHGRGLVTAAAFYYDNPQYRWFIEQAGAMHGIFGSVATRMNPMTWDPAAKMTEPTMFNGVYALPGDPRYYEYNKSTSEGLRWDDHSLPCRVPEPFDKACDRAAFRDGFKPSDAYMFLCGSQNVTQPQNNSIARYTDLGELWLYSNTMKGNGYAHTVVSISNGKSFVPVTGTTIEAIGNLGDVSAISSRESGVAGADWTRTILHLKGHYFVVLDKIQALADPASSDSAAASDFNMTCRWRSFNPASIENGVFTANAPGGGTMRIIPSEPLQQASEYWECDGASRPTVLLQQKQATLKRGEFATFQNLITVSGEGRPDEFQVKRVSPKAMLIKGKTADGEHLALVGIDGDCPLTEIQTNAPIYYVCGDRAYLFGTTDLPKNMNLALVPEDAKNSPEKPAGSIIGTLKEGSTSALLEKLWANTKDAGATSMAATDVDKNLFEKIAADKPLDQPLRRIRQLKITSDPKSIQPLAGLSDNQYSTCLAGYQPTWGATDHLTVSLDLGKPQDLACMRLVSIHKATTGPGDPEFGQAYNQPGDFTFSLELSNDNFVNDIRKIDKPNVAWEETTSFPIWHYALGRLPTWRIDIGANARYVRLMPRPTTKERPNLSLSELEVYATDKAPDLTARAFAADVDGDGSNELAVGTSNKQVALYDAEGKQRWTKPLVGDVFNMVCGDLDNSGKSEIVVYETHDETMHRFNGDSSERKPGNIKQGLMERNKSDNSGGLVALAIWGPDGADKKEVIGWSEACFRVTSDGTTKGLKSGQPRGAEQLNNFYPDEPVALAAFGYFLDIWSAKRDSDGNYIKLVSRMPSGAPGGGPAEPGFTWIRQAAFAGHKGLLAANGGGLDYFPIEALALGGNKGQPDKIMEPVKGQWHFLSGGVPLVAATIEDSVPEDQVRIFVAREDGFVNVFDLDGKTIGLINTGEPILGMCLLGEKGAARRLAVVTKFGVHVFGGDLKKLGRCPQASKSFAGPGGKNKDRVYCVDDAGKVTVVVIK